MDSAIDLKAISERIAALKKTVLELRSMGADLPCLACNTARILASLKMLEIGFCEAADLESGD
jgi:aspartate/glutamate racemase